MKNSSPIAYIRKQRKTMATVSLLVAGMQVFGYSHFFTEGETPALSALQNHSYPSRTDDYKMLFPYNVNKGNTTTNPANEILNEQLSDSEDKGGEAPGSNYHGPEISRRITYLSGKDIAAFHIQPETATDEKEAMENRQGIIGKSELFPIDDPSDNIFPAELDELPKEGQEVYLTYDLFGLADAAGACITVNDAYARGGYLIRTEDKWSTHTEKLNPAELSRGTNYIRFSTLESAGYQYMVKNVRLELKNTGETMRGFSLNQDELTAYGGYLYISGYSDHLTALEINGKTIPAADGKFETVLRGVEDEITVRAGDETIVLPVVNKEEAPDKVLDTEAGNRFIEKLFIASQENSLSGQGMKLTVPAGGIEEDRVFYLSALRYQDLSAVSQEMVNVTGSYSGFRLLPHGAHFVKSPATLEIPYDETKIPAGYKPQDIKTFYFDNLQRKWIALERDTILQDKKVIVSKTTHFTDFINGIIKVPESPETGSFTPTSIKDIKAADPAAGVVSIPPPAPNNMGTATTSFPIKLPAGRAGMQPSLSVNYNSEGGNGWMGIGWDLSVPSISIDTRWGAPRYDPAKETEIYSLAGEMLTMQVNGEYTNPHRTSNITRSSDRLFYPRREDGSYLNIQRHGSNPTNYWWEVTDKMGNKSFYGGYTGVGMVNNAVIKTADGNIAHWALYRTEDPNGNYVEYTYETTNYTGSGAGNQGTEFYLKRIDYTLNKDTSVGAYYKVDFIRNAYSVGTGNFTERKDININGRLGLVQVVSDNLTEIRIDYVYKVPQRIRTYRFDYNDPNFSKQQLTRISEYDANDDLFYYNTLEYYSEVTDGNFIDGTKSSHWDGATDQINGGLNLPGISSNPGEFTNKGSVLGFSKGTGFNGGVSLGVGLGSNFMSKANTAGVTFDYGFSRNSGVISFIDINGDNLPDKVFRENGQLFYRPNLGDTGETSGFGLPQSLSGINRFQESTSNSYNIGVEANFVLYVGYTRNKSKNVTKVYYSDVNGDGLVDVVNNGTVMFNPGEVLSSFNPVSSLTPNAIPSDTELNQDIVGDLELETETILSNENPLHDIVKRWTAPKSGIINISGTAQISPDPLPQADEENYQDYDGVCISVEHHHNNNGGNILNFGSGTCGNNKYLLDLDVNSNGDIINAGSKNMAYNNLQVQEGDHIYFRVQSREEGTHDRVEWNPQITYTSGDNTDANGFSYFSSSSSDGFIMSGPGMVTVPKGKSFSIDWETIDFSPALHFSDNLSFYVVVGRPDSEGEFVQIGSAYSKTINQTSTVSFTPASTSPAIPTTLTATGYDYMIKFIVSANSNVDWKAINWKPYVTIHEADNQEIRTNGLVNYGIYNTKIWPVTSRIGIPNPSSNPTIRVNVDYNHSSFLNTQLPLGCHFMTLVVKNSERKVLFTKKIWAKVEPAGILRKIVLYDYGSSDCSSSNTLLTPPYDIPAGADLTSVIFVEFYTDDKWLARIGNFKAHISQSNGLGGFVPRGTSEDIYAKTGNDEFGAGYHNWGQFAYNGNGAYGTDKIYEPALVLPTFDPDDVPTGNPYDDDCDDPDCFDDPPDLGLDPIGARFIVLSPNPNKKFKDDGPYYDVWEGNDMDTYIQENAFSSSRMGINNIQAILVNFEGVDNGQVRRMHLISKGKGNSYAGNFSVGPVGAGASISDGENETIIQYADMNGDRYPDVITQNKIQYTNALGKLDEVRDISFGIPSESSSSGSGGTASGTFISFETPSVSQDVQRAIAKSRGIQVSANAEVQLPSSSGLSASVGSSDNEEKSLWIDMNGDGLPDRIDLSGNSLKVRLNLGNSIVPEEDAEIWLNNVQLISHNKNYSAGVGFSILYNSISGGVSVSAASAFTQANFADLNGDGLPEYLINPTGETIGYKINLGNRFSTSTYSIEKAKINSNRSIGEGANIAFTFGFTILLAKFTITPRVGINQSINRTEHTIADINGDGYADLIFNNSSGSSTSDGDLKVRLNKTGKTHLLKRVYTPLGGSWEIDYHREGNTYEMPQSKWVVDEITTYDDFHGDHTFTPDETAITVEYTGPHHDRREREFIGFETLRVNQVNVQAQSQQDQIYRYSVQEFYNNLYYLKGAVKKESLYDKNDVLWASTETTYAIMARGETNPSNTVEDAGHVFSPADFDAAIDKSSLFVSPVSTIKKFTEGVTGTPILTATEILEFDHDGNVTEFTDYGNGVSYNNGAISDSDTSDNVHSEIQYNDSNFAGLPSIIDVTANGTLARHREAKYNAKGNLEWIKTTLNENNGIAQVSFDYDPYGNIEKVTHENSVDGNGDPFYYQYTYDDKVYTYPVLVEDAFGYGSSNTYDYRFGALVYTEDMNYMPMRTRIDDRGRVVEITGPYELFVEGLTTSDNAWTIRFEYENEAPVGEVIAHDELEFTDYVVDADGKFIPDPTHNPDDNLHHAVTRHFDPEFREDPETPLTDNEIYTITLIDGLGRPVQVKKSTSIFRGADTGTGEPDASVIDHRDRRFWLVSGKVETDAFGRARKTWYPILEGFSEPGSTASLTYNTATHDSGDTSDYTEAEYDVLDRVTKTTLPGEDDFMSTEYAIDTNLFKTTVTNEKGQVKQSFTDVRGRTTKVIEESSSPQGNIETTFEYNAIGELLKVTDAGDNETESFYDMAGRRTELRHPDNGITKFTYDNASNLVAKETSNLLAENNGDKIEYFYTFNRLDSIVYPKNPYNNVHFFYGQAQDASAADDFSVGRLWYQIDATGVQQFKYGRLGEVRYNMRSVAVPGDKAYWFKTEWEYDTWNRVKKIIYPDEEEVTYFYNRGGELHAMTSKKEGQQNEDLISQLGYDKFGQRTYLRYGNGTETEYTYEANRRRLERMTAQNSNRIFIDDYYTYDVLSNVTNVVNAPTLPVAGQIGGSVKSIYTYDDLNRLKTATSRFTGRNAEDDGYERQQYSLTMVYDKLHNITSKEQLHQKAPGTSGGTFTDIPATTYRLDYPTGTPQEVGSGYNSAGYTVDTYTYHQPHAPRIIEDKPYATSPDTDKKIKHYDYDPNGNLTTITQTTGESETIEKLRTNLWDEENRLRAVDITPDAEGVRPIAIYTYDAGGERILKHSNTSVSIYLNGKKVADTIQTDATIYPSGMLVAKLGNNGSEEEQTLAYTKHYYAGTQRISSKIGTTENLGDFLQDWITQGLGGPVDAIGSSMGVLENAEEGVVQVYDELGIDPPSYESSPTFIPVQSFIHGDDETEQYWFHPDHLGSTSYITNILGEVSQHMEYFAFGETFVEEHRSSNNSPYKFNGKELDEETGWYYYGARYYDPRVSVWLSVDEQWEHNLNKSPYIYVLNNPIALIDPDGNKEFPSYVAYLAAMGKDAVSYEKMGAQGHWLTSDRITYSNVWKQANTTNLQKSDGYKEYNTIGQRADFYGWFQKKTEKMGFETKWAGAAYVIAKQMELTDTPFIASMISDEVEQFAEDGNKAIFDDVFDDLRNLYNGSVRTCEDAEKWDAKTLFNEQFNIVDPIYIKQTKKTLGTLEKMAKQEGIFGIGAEKSLRFEGDLNNPQDRYDHGMQKAVKFWDKIRNNPNME